MNNSQHDSLKEFLLNCILNNINLSNAMITKNRKDEFLIICDCEVAGLNETSYKRSLNQTVIMYPMLLYPTTRAYAGRFAKSWVDMTMQNTHVISLLYFGQV